MTLLIIDARSVKQTQGHAQNSNDFYLEVVDLCYRPYGSFHGWLKCLSTLLASRFQMEVQWLISGIIPQGYLILVPQWPRMHSGSGGLDPRRWCGVLLSRLCFGGWYHMVIELRCNWAFWSLESSKLGVRTDVFHATQSIAKTQSM